MKINEGYKSAVNRYNSLTNSDDGRNFVSMLNHLGIPREHLLWAVERIEGEGINVHVFIQMYKEWKKYVFPYCEKQNIDIPNITQQTFQQMCTMIDTSKRYWAFPNVVYNHNGITVCKLNTYMDAHMLPIETTWCITKIPRRFEEFCGEGKDGYYIVNNSAQEPYQRTLAIIMNGEVEYWDSNNKRMAELPDYIARFKEYEKLLPKEVKEIFYSDAAKQGEQIEKLQNNKTDKNESKNMTKKNTIRLTESELKLVIAESVKRILSEEYDMNEGRLGRALGTLALGGALALGGGNLKAQNINHPQTVQMQQQNVEGFSFYAPQFKADYEKLLSYTNSKGYQNNDRAYAKDMLADFPLDRNGAIHLEYIITCDSGYDMEKIMETSYDWFNYAFSSAEASVSKYDTQNGIITARGSYANIGQFNLNAVYYAKLVRVGADTDVILRFKDNKIKVDVMIRNYRMISGESTMRSNNSLVNIADVYPANPNSDNKVAYARAFINSYSYSMDKVKKYIEFLNDNMNNEITNDDADWEISDRSSKSAKDMWNFSTPETMKQKYFEIQKQIQTNKKSMRSMEKNSEQQLAMKQKNDELRTEMQTLNQEYLKMTGQQIMQFEHPY